MRAFIIAAALAAVPAIAQDDPYKTGEDLQSVVKAKCANGCIVFSREEAAELEQTLNRVLSQKQQEAFKAGVQYQSQSCASLI